MAEVLVCSGPRVLLPESREPIPATIIIDKSSGKILQIHNRQITNSQELDLHHSSIEWIDAGDDVVLPGLVEYENKSHLCSTFRFTFSVHPALTYT